MRGEELRRVRLANLRLLKAQFTLAEIARRSSTNEKYLSQIHNEVVQQRGKSPRGLSDDYAAKIEHAFSLPSGWMDQPHDEVPSVEPPAVARVKPSSSESNSTHAGDFAPGQSHAGAAACFSGWYAPPDDQMAPGMSVADDPVLTEDEVRWLSLYRSLPYESREALVKALSLLIERS